jgi:hypothetical protein
MVAPERTAPGRAGDRVAKLDYPLTAVYYALMLLDRADILGEYDDLAEAEAALARMVDAEPHLVDVAALVPHDDDGQSAGEPIKRPAAA